MLRSVAVVLLALLGLLQPGCSYVGTAGEQMVLSVRQAGAPRQRVYKHMLARETYFVFGRIQHLPARAHGRLAVVALYDHWTTNEVVETNWCAQGDSYFGMNLPAGEYRLVVACDQDGDGRVDEREAIGGCRLVVDQAAAPDHVLGGVDINLRRRAELGATQFSVVAPVEPASTAVDSLFYPKGTIRSLDDPIFSPQMAALGLYRPAAFLERAPMTFYALEEDLGYKIPVIFVHGIEGSPRDFLPILARLDRQRYRPWFFYYPSGQELSKVAALFYRLFLSGQVIPTEDMPAIIVAHSMGGVVVREAMNHCTKQGKGNRVASLITIASPLGGHPGAHYARMAPVAIPSWSDLDPGGKFIAQLHRQALPAETRYHLIYARGEVPLPDERAQTDGVVPVFSQRSPEACREAVEQIPFDDSHTGILRDPALVERVLALCAEVKSPFPEDHLRELARGGYEVPADAGFSPMEAYFVRQIGHYMDALVSGRLRPFHPAQEEFIAACRGGRPPKYPVEHAWLKMDKILPQRARD